MRNATLFTLLLFLPVTLLPGCLSPRTVLMESRYVVQPTVDVASVPTGEDSLGIRPLQVAQPYGVQLAYVDEDHRFGYRPNAEWTEAPGDILTRSLTDAFAACGRFTDVGNAADMRIPSLILTGEIRKFHEDRTQSPPVAVCEVRLELRNARVPGLVWAETLRADVPLADGKDSGAALAEAMSASVRQVLEAAVAAVVTATAPAPPAVP